MTRHCDYTLSATIRVVGKGRDQERNMVMTIFNNPKNNLIYKYSLVISNINLGTYLTRG